MIGGFAVVVLIMCLISTPSVLAVIWEDIHPGGGGWCMGVFPHSNDPNRVWMTGDVSGMHASRDGGKTWVHDGANIALEQASYIGPLGHKNQIAVDPSTPSYVYLAQRDRGDGGYKKGLWRSTDTGTTWEYVNSPNSSLFRDASITVDWNGVLFGAQHGTKTLLVSTDHGATIIAKSTLPMIACSADSYTNSMVVKASTKNWIYLSDGTGNTSGLYYTTNRGDSWDSVSVLSDKYVIALGCSPTDGGVVVALTKSGDIYQATDGRNFSKRFSIGTKGRPPRIAGDIDINAQGVVIAKGSATKNGFAISYNNGTTFEYLIPTYHRGDYVFPSLQNHNCTDLAAFPAGDRWYFTTSVNVFVSEDNGKNWTARCKGIQMSGSQGFPVVDRSNPDRVHLGAGDTGHLYTTDGGVTWISDEGGFASCAAIAQDPDDDAVFYKMYGRQGSKRGFYKSTNYGLKDTWTKVSFYPSGHWAKGFIIIDFADSNHIYYSEGYESQGQDGVYESFDGGKTWKIMPGAPDRFYWVIQTPGGDMYGLRNVNTGPLWRYRKSTRTWEKFHPGTVSGFAIHPDDENIVFACVGSHEKNWGGPSFGYLEKTTDGGRTWQRIKDEKGDDFSPWRIYIDPVRPEVMLMNTTHHWDAQGKPTGIMRSLDGGQTWHSIQANHNYHWPDCFAYGGVPGRVYTAWHNGGFMSLHNLYEPGSAAKPVDK